MDIWLHVAAAIAAATSHPCTILRHSPISGGSINSCFRLDCSGNRSYFVKLNQARHHAMLQAEADGLACLAATQTLRTPAVVTNGITDVHAFLVLEFLTFSARGDAAKLGEQLAELHRHSAETYGHLQDNFIGTTPQPNPRTADWTRFWQHQRLGYQLRLAYEQGHEATLRDTGDSLLAALPAFFSAYHPRPSLLHGDLWSGNHAYIAHDMPVIFDPAVYYGDRECDIAMTELFSGFPPRFYQAYRAAWPLDEGYRQRRDLYNLYHLLNHANLFGGSYVREAAQLMQRLLRTVD